VGAFREEGNPDRSVVCRRRSERIVRILKGLLPRGSWGVWAGFGSPNSNKSASMSVAINTQNQDPYGGHRLRVVRFLPEEPRAPTVRRRAGEHLRMLRLSLTETHWWRV